MRPFGNVRSRAISIPDGNVDTDIIFPARFLLVTEKKGLGRYAFFEHRYDGEGQPIAGFPLNDESRRGAEILVVGPNFGCGSSREQAPWALNDLGFRVIIAPSFGEIFYANCCKNGMLPVVLGDDAVSLLHAERGVIAVDLPSRTVRLADDTVFSFVIEAKLAEALLHGWDDIARIRALNGPAIAAYEHGQAAAQPWLWDRERPSR